MGDAADDLMFREISERSGWKDLLPENQKKVGAFDAWVIDEQEKAARERYHEYLAECPTDIPAQEWPASALSFEEWCDNEKQNERD